MPRSRRSTIKSLLFGLLAAVLFTLAAMLALAAALLVWRIGDGTLRLLNQFIKLAAIILGVCLAVPRGGERGLASGVLIALAYAVTGCVMYAALGGTGLDFPSFLGELLLGAAAGAVTGAVRANLRPRKRRFTAPVKS